MRDELVRTCSTAPFTISTYSFRHDHEPSSTQGSPRTGRRTAGIPGARGGAGQRRRPRRRDPWPRPEPSAFRIVDGKLYLNLSPAVQKRWQADIPGFIERANQNWPGLKGQ